MTPEYIRAGHVCSTSRQVLHSFAVWKPIKDLLFLHNMGQYNGSSSAMLICNQIILAKYEHLYEPGLVAHTRTKVIIYHLSMIPDLWKVIPFWFTVNKDNFSTFSEVLQRILYSWPGGVILTHINIPPSGTITVYSKRSKGHILWNADNAYLQCSKMRSDRIEGETAW